MKKSAKLLLMSVFLSAVFICLPGLIFAQIGNPCDTQDPDLWCPIDGGVWILLAIGLVYGFIKWKAISKKKVLKITS